MYVRHHLVSPFTSSSAHARLVYIYIQTLLCCAQPCHFPTAKKGSITSFWTLKKSWGSDRGREAFFGKCQVIERRSEGRFVGRCRCQINVPSSSLGKKGIKAEEKKHSQTGKHTYKPNHRSNFYVYTRTSFLFFFISPLFDHSRTDSEPMKGRILQNVYR